MPRSENERVAHREYMRKFMKRPEQAIEYLRG